MTVPGWLATEGVGDHVPGQAERSRVAVDVYTGVGGRQLPGWCSLHLLLCCYRLVGLVVKASASRAGGPGFESRLRRDFFGVESYQ